MINLRKILGKIVCKLTNKHSYPNGISQIICSRCGEYGEDRAYICSTCAEYHLLGTVCPKKNKTEVTFYEVNTIEFSTFKELKNKEIAKRNVDKQKSTLGYGLKGSFKPRSSHEKRLWDLSKKIEEED